MHSPIRHAPCFLALLCILGGAHHAVAAPLPNPMQSSGVADTTSLQRKQDNSSQIGSVRINNQNGVVTVRGKDDTPLFAQVIATKKLKIDLSTEAKSSKLKVTLRDENNKKVWETRIGERNPNTFSFQWKEGPNGAEGIILSLTSQEGANGSTYNGEEKDDSKGSIVLDNDGRIDHADLFPDGDGVHGGGVHMERKGKQYVMYNYDDQGKRVQTGTVDIDAVNKQFAITAGDQVYSISNKDKDTVVVKDVTGSIKIGKVVKDGKTYIDMDLGDRHIFIEGTAYEVKSDGKDITVNLRPDSK